MFDKVAFFETNPNQLSIKNSTPLTSSSNLQIDRNTDNLQIETVKRTKFMNSTIFLDQKIIKNELGVFRIYGGIDAISWFSKVKQFCCDNYANPSEIIVYFHILLDSEFHLWLFKVPSDKKSNLDVFEKEFLEEAFRIESEYECLVISKQSDFIKKFKEIFNKENLDAEISMNPLSSFIKLKIMVIKRLYPNLPKKDAIRLTIFSLDDKDVRRQFSRFIHSDLIDILNYAKSIDAYKEK